MRLSLCAALIALVACSRRAPSPTSTTPPALAALSSLLASRFVNASGALAPSGTVKGALVFVPRADAQGHVIWDCTNGEGLKPTQLPPTCSRGEQH